MWEGKDIQRKGGNSHVMFVFRDFIFRFTFALHIIRLADHKETEQTMRPDQSQMDMLPIATNASRTMERA